MTASTIKALLHTLVGILIAVILFSQLLFYYTDARAYSNYMLVEYGIIAIILFGYLCVSDVRAFSPFYIIILYTIVSHFGISIISMFDLQAVSEYTATNRHIYLETLPKALQISTIGTICLLIGYNRGNNGVIKSYSNNDKSANNENASNQFDKCNASTQNSYLNFGIAVYYIYAIILLYLTIRYNLFFASYTTVKSVLTSGALIVHIRPLFWVATLPISIYFNKNTLKKILIPAILIFVILMFTGNRNDILYPLAIGYSLYCYKNNKTSLIVNILAAVILFVINPTISENRGSGDLLNANYNLKVSDAIMEMGAQIRPLTVTISLVNRKTIPFFYGLSIVLPTIADLNLGIFYSGSAYRDSIYCIPNILAIDNHYGQGYSMISEFWINFGILGTIILTFLIGYFCAKKEKIACNDSSLIKYGGYSLLLFYWTRNSLMMNAEIIVMTYLMVFICEKMIRNNIRRNEE